MITARIFGFLALLLFSLQATTLEQLSLDDMTAKSTAIVHGQVGSSYVVQNGSIIFTHFKIQVIDQWKGKAATEVDVAVPGGTMGRKTQTVAGAPLLQAGAEYVFFLWTGKSGITQIIGLSQGILTVSTDATGAQSVTRAGISEQMVGSSGHAVQDAGIQMKLSDFSRRVAGTLAAGSRR